MFVHGGWSLVRVRKRLSLLHRHEVSFTHGTLQPTTHNVQVIRDIIGRI